MVAISEIRIVTLPLWSPRKVLNCKSLTTVNRTSTRRDSRRCYSLSSAIYRACCHEAAMRRNVFQHFRHVSCLFTTWTMYYFPISLNLLGIKGWAYQCLLRGQGVVFCKDPSPKFTGTRIPTLLYLPSAHKKNHCERMENFSTTI